MGTEFEELCSEMIKVDVCSQQQEDEPMMELQEFECSSVMPMGNTYYKPT